MEAEIVELAWEIYGQLLNRQGTVGEVDLERYAEYSIHAAEVMRGKIKERIGELEGERE